MRRQRFVDNGQSASYYRIAYAVTSSTPNRLANAVIMRAEPRAHDAFAQFFAGGSTDGGTGLGLSVAQWATHQQGGTIKVATIGPGRHVKISLPTAPENEHTELD